MLFLVFGSYPCMHIKEFETWNMRLFGLDVNFVVCLGVIGNKIINFFMFVLA